MLEHPTEGSLKTCESETHLARAGALDSLEREDKSLDPFVASVPERRELLRLRGGEPPVRVPKAKQKCNFIFSS